MNFLAILAALKNTQFTDSVKAGGAASILIFAAGGVLLTLFPAAAIPAFTILGMHIAATPITMTMVSALAVPVGHVVTAMVPDSVKQQIDGLAAKLPKIQAMIPTTYSEPSDFPNAPPAALVAAVETPPNATQAEKAVAVIAVHDNEYPTGKNGA